MAFTSRLAAKRDGWCRLKLLAGKDLLRCARQWIAGAKLRFYWRFAAFVNAGGSGKSPQQKSSLRSLPHCWVRDRTTQAAASPLKCGRLSMAATLAAVLGWNTCLTFGRFDLWPHPKISFDPFKTRDTFNTGGGRPGILTGSIGWKKRAWGRVSNCRSSIRVLLESLLRNCDGYVVTENDVKALAAGMPPPPAQSRRFRSSRPASCCRISPACRASSIWRRCARR